MNMPLSSDALLGADPTRDMDCDFAVYRTLLESTMAIPWKIDWATKRFAYIGPQIEKLLGWRQDSWASVEDWVARIHPDDREYVFNFCVSQSIAGIDHEADYRALTASGDFVWIRDVVHVVRRPGGEVDCLIGFMFDITERKKNEHELLEMQKKLETLSYQDGLTGAANRRMFDNRLETEWMSAARTRQPLSLILLDIDHFKQFNDYHGHAEGDECLIRVAAALKQVGCRPRDIVARYGGEEFVLLLPDTSEASARQLAERCQRAIADLRIVHGQSSCSPHVTASIGVSTITPQAGDKSRMLFDAADKLLYSAKQVGRNRIMAAIL